MKCPLFPHGKIILWSNWFLLQTPEVSKLGDFSVGNLAQRALEATRVPPPLVSVVKICPITWMITLGPPLTNDLRKVFNPPRKAYEKHLGSEPKLSIQKVLSQVFKFSSETSWKISLNLNHWRTCCFSLFPPICWVSQLPETLSFQHAFPVWCSEAALSYLFQHHQHHHHHDLEPWIFTSQCVAPTAIGFHASATKTRSAQVLKEKPRRSWGCGHVYMGM